MKENDTFAFFGLLYFDELSSENVETIEDIFDKLELEASVSDIELDFETEDVDRATYKKIITALKKIATIVKDGEGEIECEVANEDEEDADPTFEFFKIQGGKLWRQKAKIVREAAKLVE